MPVHVSNRRYANTTALPGTPMHWGFGILIVLLCILALAFHEQLGAMFAGISPAPSNSIRGEWVGVLDLPQIRDPWVRPYGKHAVIRFTLAPEKDFLSKYGGKGEIVFPGQAPQPIEVTHLWLPKDAHTYECGLWKVPYQQGDQKDFLSGGFEGTFQPGALTLTRQTAVGYDMTGTLHKGTDQEFDQLVQQMQGTTTHTGAQP